MCIKKFFAELNTPKKILLSVVGLIVLLVAIGIFGPAMKVERSIVINKSEGQVFNYLLSMKNQEKWSPWLKMDPEAKVKYKGDARVGAVSSWDGNDDLGAGEQEIKAIKKKERIDMELRFTRPMEGTSQAWFITEPVEGQKNQTKVTWGFTGEKKLPCSAMTVFMKPYMNHMFDSGLKDLKAVLEK